MLKIIERRYPLFLAAALAAACFAHVHNLTAVPRGFYCDEMSNGLNAAAMSETMRDEHNVFMPLYFKTYGWYTDPLYIYTNAAVFKLAGISEFTLRLTSVLYYFVFLLFFLMLVKIMSQGNKTVLLYAVAAAGFTPWIFTCSRIAFTTISQAAVASAAMYFIYAVFHGKEAGNRNIKAAVAGLFLGLCFYTYATTRLLTALAICGLVIIYINKANIKKLLIICCSFVAVMIPAIVFALKNPEAMTARFGRISYINDASISFYAKMWSFIKYYVNYFNPYTLLIKGDEILRHSTGYGGELFATTFILLIAGTVAVMFRKKDRRFGLFLTFNLLCAPIAAALVDSRFSATRSILMAVYILIISCMGFEYLLIRFGGSKKEMVAAIVIAGTVFQAFLYAGHYFLVYPEKSTEWFEGYGYKEALEKAIRLGPKKIIISKYANQAYTYLGFYRYVVPNEKRVPIVLGEPLRESDTCVVIHSAWDRQILKRFGRSGDDLTPEERIICLKYYSVQ
ncbi:MAG: hypothetical protein AAB956_00175 [Patescibacteria group bacterium]